MPSLCDVNFLLPLCHEVHEHHSIAKGRLASVSAAGEFVVCRTSQLGLLRLLSTPAAMKEINGASAVPFATWENLRLMVANGELFGYLGYAATNYPYRFYRARQVP